jgi:hypothetical protein
MIKNPETILPALLMLARTTGAASTQSVRFYDARGPRVGRFTADAE